MGVSFPEQVVKLNLFSVLDILRDLYYKTSVAIINSSSLLCLQGAGFL
jgi:hypothetical protein